MGNQQNENFSKVSDEEFQQSFEAARESDRAARRGRASHLQAVAASSQVQRVSWTKCDHKLLLAMLDAAIEAGGAVRLGATRDGGAWSIGVYCGEAYFTEYVRDEELLDEYLEDVTDYFATSGNHARDAGQPASGTGSAARRRARGKH